MARIRTVKPELFSHEDLFDAERETGLPLRLAFIGLFTCCDREGRFKWRPRPLKLDVLPYDDVDFSRVLDALATRGFIRKYASGTEEYGVIPTWEKHQVINNRESASDIPVPTESSYISVPSTREARVDDAKGTPLVQVQGEGKGREEEGKGKEHLVDLTADRDASENKPEKKSAIIARIFAYWQEVMNSPGSALDAARKTLIETALKNYRPEDICEAIRGCAMTEHNMGINDRNTKYNGLNIILKNGDNIDRFINKARANPAGKPVGKVQTDAEYLADVQAALDRMNGQGAAVDAEDPNIIDMEQ